VAAHGHHPFNQSAIEVRAGEETGPVRVGLTALAAGEHPQLELAGIGAQLTPQDDGLAVARVMPESGAEKAGLGPGDLIVEIDGRPVTELGFDGAIQAIRCPVGSKLRITLRRPSGKVESLDVERRKIKA
jgi:C-terminal processing protease CtpA/Prc